MVTTSEVVVSGTAACLPFHFVELAQEVNARMPAYVVARVTRLLNGERKAVNGAKVLLLG